jgi:predicted TIM-barrel fold metal-dependent hydrolase
LCERALGPESFRRSRTRLRPAAAPHARPRTAVDLIAQLDAAGIKRAVVLSAAYIFEQPSRIVDSPAEKVRRENAWNSRQVAQFPDRLIGFCSVNPR